MSRTAAALDLIRAAKAEGLRRHLRHRAALFRPERDGDRRLPHLCQALAAAAARRRTGWRWSRRCADGTIDAIASDHQPRDADDKRLPFAQAEAGGAGLATLLAVTLARVHGGDLTLLQALDLLTAGPAALLGLAAGTAGARARRPTSCCSIPTAAGR